MSRKIQQHELNLDLKILKKIKTLREFDNTITAPMHGFVNAMDYWQRASAKPVLHQITTPTIIINAENDPFIPKYSLPQDHEVSKEVTLLRTKQGGHVGFVSGHWPGQLKWLPETLVQYFQHCLISQER
jgi:predicted alpha/beta-fold hydrolase